MSLFLWTLVIGLVTAITCSLCGVFLVVKRESLVSEALSHAVLPGIIVAFIVFQDRSSPWLIISAGLMGLIMVWLVQLIRKTNLVDGEAALGIVFSALFSIGILFVSLNFRKTHFDAHCIIDGNLASASLRTLEVGGVELGPKAFFVMLTMLIIVLGFVIAFYKELKLAMFDPTLSQGLGFRPGLMHLLWLGVVSMTTVAAFETAGSILVVALMIAPPAAAFLLTRRVSTMLIVSCLIGVLSALLGIYIGDYFYISPTGPIASTAGLIFLVALTVAPGQGLWAKHRNRSRQRKRLFEQLLLARLESVPGGLTIEDAFAEITWTSQQFQQTVANCGRENWIEQSKDNVTITAQGRAALQWVN